MINNSNTNSKKENNENENNTHIGFPQNLYEFLKEKKKLLVKVEDAGGRSPKGKALIMHIQSIFDYSLKKYLYRQLKPTADFEWEFFISKAMGEIGVSPKVIHESHKDKYFMMDFIENSVNLRTGMVPDEECIRQTGIYLRKIHDFSPAKKPPDSNNFMAKVFKILLKKNFNDIFI